MTVFSPLLTSVPAWSPVALYLVLFLATLIEGPLITMIAGLFSSHHIVNSFIMYPIIVAAELMSDSLYYCLGRWGNGLSKKYLNQRDNGDTNSRNHLKKLFAHHPGKTIFLGKITHVAGVPTLLSAGHARVPFGTFFLFEVLATIPKTLILFLIGFYLGSSIKKIDSYALNATIVVTGCFGAWALLTFVRERK